MYIYVSCLPCPASQASQTLLLRWDVVSRRRAAHSSAFHIPRLRYPNSDEKSRKGRSEAIFFQKGHIFNSPRPGGSTEKERHYWRMQNNCTTSDRFKRFVFQRCRLLLVVNVKKKYTQCKYATLYSYETVAR
jgi:hypothetical protein